MGEIEMADTKRAMQCGHCGEHPAFLERGECRQHGDVLVDPDKSGYQYEFWQKITTWRVLECTLCERPTLVQELVSYHFDFDDVEGRVRKVESAETVILYPQAPTRTILIDLPQTVEKAYRTALDVQTSPNAFAVLAGRTLEAACNHEKAPGRDLASKLNHLANSGHIPQTLGEMAQQLRLLRNLGAHDAEDEVNQDDVPIILDFLEAILEYLYIAPAKINAVKARLAKADEKKGRGTGKTD